jgi:hypothetical protein
MKRRMTDRKLRLMPETLQNLDSFQVEAGGPVQTRPGQLTCYPCYPLSYPRTACPETCS